MIFKSMRKRAIKAKKIYQHRIQLHLMMQMILKSRQLLNHQISTRTKVLRIKRQRSSLRLNKILAQLTLMTHWMLRYLPAKRISLSLFKRQKPRNKSCNL